LTYTSISFIIDKFDLVSPIKSISCICNWNAEYRASKR